MPKTLVIAEKPSVAQDIARALGGTTKKTASGGKASRDSWQESDDYVITSAVGHLLELDDPHNAAAKKAKDNGAKKPPSKWQLESLPSIPDGFDLVPLKEGRDRLKQIKSLAKRDDIGAVVNACDAGREGELIFHNLASHLGIDEGSVKRLWLQSMTPEAIRDGFANLRPSADFRNLRSSAIARTEADWLVGINATRALTALNSKGAGFVLTPAGRVQTPTLTLLVDRELERRKHVPRPYWTLAAEFKVASGGFEAKWMQSEQDKSGDKQRGRIWDEDRARRLHELVSAPGASGVASDASKDRQMAPPALYDLNTLQKEANRLHSLPARRTLGALQALYERHKLVTYPRTESRHLPPDYESVCVKTLAALAGDAGFGAADQALGQALAAAKSRVGSVGKKVFDSAKISDHFAIIPTGELPKGELPDIERKVYDLVRRRFAAAFLPSAKVRETVRTVQIGDERFEARGRVVVEPGYLAVVRNALQDKELPPLAGATESAAVAGTELKALETKPTSRYDEAALLAAMQGASKFVDDKDLSEALAGAGGLGTPATRASIIEELISKGYVVREGRELVPTSKALFLLELLRGMAVDQLTQPRLTGEWESRLQAIEEGAMAPEEFLAGIKKMVEGFVQVAKVYDADKTPGDYVQLKAPCPLCGEAKIEEGYRKYSCRSEGCEFFLWKMIGGRLFAPAEVEQLLTARLVGPFDDFRSRLGFPFSASVRLSDSGQPELEFEPTDEEKLDPAECPDVGLACPVCKAKVRETPASYMCERKFASTEGKCGFKIGKVICKREMACDELASLVVDGKTGLLEDFISKRGKPFKAILHLDKNGKLKFEFEARPAKKAAKKPAKKPAKKAAKKQPAAAS